MRPGSGGSAPGGARLVTGYYLATPLFAVADLAVAAPVRVAGVLTGGPRVGYFLAVFALGVLCRVRPGAAPWVGMAESSVNLLLLLLSILLPIWSLADPGAGAHPLPVGLTPAAAGNALLSGAALVLSFHRHQAAALQKAERLKKGLAPWW